MIGRKIIELYLFIFVASLYADFGRRVLSVWKFVKNRGLEQTAGSKRQSNYNDEFYTTALSGFEVMFFIVRMKINEKLKTFYKIFLSRNFKNLNLCKRAILIPNLKRAIYIALDSEKCMTSLFEKQFFGILSIVGKNNILGIQRNF